MKTLFQNATLAERVAVNEDNRRRIAALEPEMLALDAIGKRKGRTAAFADAAARVALKYRSRCGRVLNAKAIEAIFYRWRGEGWRALCRNYRPSKLHDGLPRAFIQFWKSLYLLPNVNRSGKSAYRELIRRWNAWRKGDATAAIPGYAECPPCAVGARVPLGWSAGNLLRKKYRPSLVEATSVKRGLLAAREHAPHIRKLRPDAPGKAFQFDDVWHDIYVSAPGFSKLVRPLAFGCLDESSGYYALTLTKPRLPETGDDAKTKHIQLNGEEMALLLATWASEVGWHRDGCVLKVENGTAAISPEQEEMLALISGGKIRVERGAMLAGKGYAGAYAGNARGNFRHKAALESLHSLLHTEQSLLPGYSGNNRDVPENTQGMIRARAKLYKENADLPPALRDMISAGELTFDEFQSAMGEIVANVNARTDHDLADWEKRITREYRTDAAEDFRPVTAATNAAVLAALGGDPNFIRVRKMSPREVWTNGLNALVRADYREAALLCRKFFKICRVNRNHEIAFTDGQMRERHTFLARIKTLSGATEVLGIGEMIHVFYNPFAADRGILVFNADGTFRGESAEEIKRIDQDDEEALVRAIGTSESVFREAVRGASALTDLQRARTAVRIDRNRKLREAHVRQLACKRIAQNAHARIALDDAELDDFDAPEEMLPPPPQNFPADDADDEIPW